MRGFVVGPRAWRLLLRMLSHITCLELFFCRFSVGSGGSLSVTIDPRQAIAVHTRAMGAGIPVPTAQQVSVLFSENATTSYGEVSSERFWLGLLFQRTSGAKRSRC
jgi:hypothetical protein